MGLMKRHLEEKVAEFAKMHGKTEQEIYESDGWYNLAVKYAEQNYTSIAVAIEKELREACEACNLPAEERTEQACKDCRIVTAFYTEQGMRRWQNV